MYIFTLADRNQRINTHKSLQYICIAIPYLLFAGFMDCKKPTGYFHKAASK